MVSTRLVRVLMVALSLSATAQAVVIDAAAADVALVNRQDNASSAGTTPTGASPSASQPNTTPTAPPSSNTTPTTTPPTANPTPSSTPVNPPTTSPTTTPGGVSPTAPTSPTTAPTPTTTSTRNTSPPATTSAPQSSMEVPTTIFVVETKTLENGSTTVQSSAIPTKTSVLVPASSSTSDEEAQAKNKNIIIGVCVGVGGAIVLAVAGVLFWRLRNKKRQEVDQDDLQSFGTGYGPPSTAEKTEGTNNTRSPFQSTLESYHAPTQTNTASNF
ncbi:hypothetical protein Micbo1qcDRAFT_158956 [Microdochium bolleyi]|uniref:Mid2 domain-containing protein n=1 Tax=Microdochium bolleyi TaxID=196109 RepID=A0A136JA20_9PEZI|nr:hypothetical protein Micbo1qcDRAFT_158956 [Microdochium bolleyi]